MIIPLLKVDREFRVQKALFSAGFPVPQPLLLCTDAEVIGTDFYLMEHVKVSLSNSSEHEVLTSKIYSTSTLPLLHILIMIGDICTLLLSVVAIKKWTPSLKLKGVMISCLLLVQGRVFRDLRLPGVRAAERAALYVAAVEVLAKLHSMDLASLNLEGYGKGTGYCKRQVRQPNQSKQLRFYRYDIQKHLILLFRCPPGQSNTSQPPTETFQP